MHRRIDVRETLHRLRYRVWGPRLDEASNCRTCAQIIAPFQGVRERGQVFCTEDHVTTRHLDFHEVWAW